MEKLAARLATHIKTCEITEVVGEQSAQLGLLARYTLEQDRDNPIDWAVGEGRIGDDGIAQQGEMRLSRTVGDGTVGLRSSKNDPRSDGAMEKLAARLATHTKTCEVTEIIGEQTAQLGPSARHAHERYWDNPTDRRLNEVGGGQTGDEGGRHWEEMRPGRKRGRDDGWRVRRAR